MWASCGWGAISTAMTGLLPPALHRLAASAPGIDVFLLPGTSTDVYRQVSDGSLDAAILVRPPFVIPKSLDWVRLRTEPLVMICPRGLGAGRSAGDACATGPSFRYDRNNWGGRLADRWMKDMALSVRGGAGTGPARGHRGHVGSGLWRVRRARLGAALARRGLRLRRLPLPGPALRPVREIGAAVARAAPSARLILQVCAGVAPASALQAEGGLHRVGAWCPP